MQSGKNKQRTVIDEVIIEPHDLQKVFIGIYEGKIPKPYFTIESKPDVGELLSATLEKKEENGEYSLTYFLQNYSDETCRVRIVEGGPHGNQRVV